MFLLEMKAHIGEEGEELGWQTTRIEQQQFKQKLNVQVELLD